MCRLQHINVEVTKRCNQQCFYCFNNSGPTATRSSIEVEDWLIIFRILRNHGLESIHLTGGEPFVWEGTIRVLTVAQDLGLETSILSNGLKISTLSSKHPRVFTKLNVAQISLDAITPEVHNERRGLPGAWEHATSAIEALCNLGTPVEISCVVSEENLPELEDLADYCWQQDAQLILRPLVPVGRGGNQRMDYSSLFDRVELVRDYLDDMYAGLIVSDRFDYVPSPSDSGEEPKKPPTVTPAGTFRSGHLSLPDGTTLENVKDLV